MRYSYGLLGLAALVAASDVADLTKATFNDFVTENNLVLAECMCIISSIAPDHELT